MSEYKKNQEDIKKSKKSYSKKSFGSKSSDKKFSKNKSSNKKSYEKGSLDDKYSENKSFNKNSYGKKTFGSKSSDKKFSEDKSSNKKSYNKGSLDDTFSENKSFYKNSYGKKTFDSKSSDKKFSENKSSNKKSYNKGSLDDKFPENKSNNKKSYEKKPYEKKSLDDKFLKKEHKHKNEGIRLNRYIAICGYCSRREADNLISTGSVSVNGKIITQLGTRITESDKVMIGVVAIKPEKKIYILMNKPKDYITTSKDPQNRKTVMNLLGDMKFRVYPVGRLDRNTTGILLFTNDGDLARKLTHPSSNILKIYEVKLDKNLKINDLQKIIDGIYIDGHKINVDEISYIEDKPHNYVGISIHSGQYHIVKKIFESLGYKVLMLDRTMFGPLTKKNVPRGTWRYLTDSEVRLLMNL
ncbi:MAG TPA: pseudouridine synthase [Bacteroidales bacterium]|nr:pseudouridine synthase [Bacteroidales bacterium]HOS19932.1 pseudouridine synthase [Bacteroidales bacterium]